MGMNNEAKPTKAQITALAKLAAGGGSNQMRAATRTALHQRGWMAQGKITEEGLALLK